ncbi:MAG: DNA sulfur modification protein DndE [Kordiimonas sp.]
MSLDYIKLSQGEKDQLVRLKRHTGIEQWNILCRWALCVSLYEPTRPPITEIHSDSNVEMTWRIFAGQFEDLYLDLLKVRCVEDGLGTDTDTLYQQFRLHLKRGLGYLTSNKKTSSIHDLIKQAV